MTMVDFFHIIVLNLAYEINYISTGACRFSIKTRKDTNKRGGCMVYAYLNKWNKVIKTL